MLVQINEHLRIELGPKLKTAIATKTLLDDSVTAQHYKIASKDALGKPIVLDEEFTYLDWLGEHTWYVYVLDQGIWSKVGAFDGEKDDAIEHALTIQRG